MKITKSTLKRIIKEELKSTLLDIRLEEGRPRMLEEGEVWDAIKWMFKNPKEALRAINDDVLAPDGPIVGVDPQYAEGAADLEWALSANDPEACLADPTCREKLEAAARQEEVQAAAERDRSDREGAQARADWRDAAPYKKVKRVRAR